jgi:hypothetical protein
MNDGSPESLSAIPRIEWDFDNVPDSELVACCWWEYARESAFIVDTERRFRQWIFDGCMREHPGFEEIDRNLRQIHGAIPYESDVFLSAWESFPDPWQSQGEDQRKARAHIRSYKEAASLKPVELGTFWKAREIAERCEMRAEDHLCRQQEWIRKNFRPDEKGRLVSIPGAPGPPEFVPPRPGIFTGGTGEALLLRIAWKHFTNDQIADYFRKVLPNLRPHAMPAPDRRGHKLKDVRADLTCLAAMRILNAYTLTELLSATRVRVRGGKAVRVQLLPASPDCAPVLESKQFSDDQWLNEHTWYEARRDAWKTYHQLFPFLPKDEKPYHWGTEGERRKSAKSAKYR